MRYPPAPWALLAPLWLTWVALAPVQAQDVAVVGGTVHPVSGPAIDNGVVLLRGDRIIAVGPRDQVEVPATATVLSYPQAHVYPGLVDALSDAFADDSVLNDSSSDAGTAIADGLDRHQVRSQVLVNFGVTTAYVRNRGNTRWRGIGAVLRPRADGFELLDDRQPAVQMLLRGTGNHPLNRHRALAAAGDAFEAIEAYRKRFADHEAALADYETKYQEYLAYHRGRGGAPDAEPARGGRRGLGRRGRGQRPRGQGSRGQDAGGQRGQRGGGRRRGGGEQAADQSGGQTEARTEGEEGGTEDPPPARPEYPDAPRVEPDKEALHAVLAAERTLRIDVRRADEVRAALQLARQYAISRVVLENADESGPMAADLARQGVPVVLSDILTGAGDAADLPARLAESEVAIAIASGSVRRARHLPMLAAHAVGAGVDEATALRAITLTPAEIIGVSRDVGSLEAGKLADIVVFSAPIFSSDARVLLVLSAGSTQYEAR